MASAFEIAATPPRKAVVDEARGRSAYRWMRSDWLNCKPETPWGVHGKMKEDRCTRCGWKP